MDKEYEIYIERNGLSSRVIELASVGGFNTNRSPPSNIDESIPYKSKPTQKKKYPFLCFAIQNATRSLLVIHWVGPTFACFDLDLGHFRMMHGEYL